MNTCGGTSYGTVTLTDDGLAAGQVRVIVELVNNDQGFRDLMLNYTGSIGALSSSDGQAVVLSPDAFSINPYDGLFDVGVSGGQGWKWATSQGADYTTILSAAGLTLGGFDVLDSESKLAVALHIQNIGSVLGGDCDGSGTKPPCDPTQTGTGSLKIGGVPEPSTLLLMSGGLLGLSYWRRQRSGPRR